MGLGVALVLIKPHYVWLNFRFSNPSFLPKHLMEAVPELLHAEPITDVYDGACQLEGHLKVNTPSQCFFLFSKTCVSPTISFD